MARYTLSVVLETSADRSSFSEASLIMDWLSELLDKRVEVIGLAWQHRVCARCSARLDVSEVNTEVDEELFVHLGNNEYVYMAPAILCRRCQDESK